MSKKADAACGLTWKSFVSSRAKSSRLNEVVVTSVEANNQPADIGVRVGALDTSTLQFRTSKLSVPSAPNQNVYAVQPTISYLAAAATLVRYFAKNASVFGQESLSASAR